jgi:hypothetical protein
VPTAESRAAAAPRSAREGKTADEVPVELSRQGASLKLSFPFRTPAAAAVFHRADTLWIAFDSTVPIDVSAPEGKRAAPSAARTSFARPTPTSFASGLIARICRALRPKGPQGRSPWVMQSSNPRTRSISCAT